MNHHLKTIPACTLGLILALSLGCSGSAGHKDNNKNCPDVKLDQMTDNDNIIERTMLTMTSKSDQMMFKDVQVFQTKTPSDMDNDVTKCSISGWNREGRNNFTFITKIPEPTALNHGQSLSFPTTCEPLTGAVIDTDFGMCKYSFK